MPERARGPVVVVDRERCMGSGMCVLYAPCTFAHDDEARAVAADPPGDPLERLRTAVEACPTGAISMSGDDGHQGHEFHEEGA